MTHVDAIFQNGVFRPLGEVEMTENQRVRLSVQPLGTADAQAWLTAIQQRQREIIAKRGFFPDSSKEIAEDRLR